MTNFVVVSKLLNCPINIGVFLTKYSIVESANGAANSDKNTAIVGL